MAIKANDLRLYVGAASLLVPPITSGECTLFPSLELLVRAEGVAGRGATIRHGLAFAKRTPAELAAACAADPLITGYNGASRLVVGVRFFEKSGPAKLEVSQGAVWVERGTDIWQETMIRHVPPPLVPGWWVRVTNKYGLVSNEFAV